MSESIAKSVAVSFARRYYTTLVEKPSELAAFYATNATVQHLAATAVKGTGADLQKLLSTKSFGSLGTVSRVAIKSLSVADATSGNINVTVEGALHGSAPGLATTNAGQAFVQEFTLREIAASTYAIAADTLRFGTGVADSELAWALETPPMFARAPTAEVAELKQPAATTEVPPPTAAAPETTATTEAAAPVEEETPVAAPAPAVESAPKAPQSFAEALKMRKATDDKKPAAPVRVTDKPVTAPAAHKDDKKKAKPTAGARRASTAEDGKKTGSATTAAAAGDARKRPARTPAAATAVVFYDVVIKNLPPSSTEEEVRAMLPADVPVSLVKVGSKAARSDPADLRTFAFVQLDAAALKTSNTAKKEAIAKVVSEGTVKGEAQKITFEEVRERKKFTVGADGAKSSPHSRPAASGAAAKQAGARPAAPRNAQATN